MDDHSNVHSETNPQRKINNSTTTHPLFPCHNDSDQSGREGWQVVTSKRRKPTWPGLQRTGQEQEKQMFWQDKLGGTIYQVSQGRSGLYLNNSTNNHSGGHLQASAGSQPQATPPSHRQAPSRPPHHLQVRHRAPAIHQTSYSSTYHDNSNNNSNNYNIQHHEVRSPTTSVHPRFSSYPHLANSIGTSDTGRSSLYHATGGDNYDQDYPPLPPPIHLPTTRGRCYN